MEFREEYQAAFSKATASEETYRRVMNMKQKGKYRRRGGSMLRKAAIAAAIVSALMVTASAAEIKGWFVQFFSDNSQQDLSDGQVAYIEDNVQESIAVPVQETEAPEEGDGCKLEVKSAITDGTVAYVTVDITAPEDFGPEEIRFTDPLLIPDRTEGLRIAPDGSSPDALCDYMTMEDADGLNNTKRVVFTIQPALEDPNTHPFDGSIHWTMRLSRIETSFFNGESFEHTTLSENSWDFALTFQPADVREVELIQEPIPLMASKWLNNDYQIEVELTSFVISGLSYQTSFKINDPAYAEELLDIGQVQIVMKDGSTYTMACLSTWGNGNFAAPIVLDDVDHILIVRDGTKIPMPQ